MLLAPFALRVHIAQVTITNTVAVETHILHQPEQYLVLPAQVPNQKVVPKHAVVVVVLQLQRVVEQ